MGEKDKAKDLDGLYELRRELAGRLAEARAALPAHSVRPHQYQRVEELEEALAEVEARLAALEKGA